MSAICGIFNLDGKPVLREEIEAMMKPMAYWGPDDSGIWVDGPVGFGHLMLHTTPESLHEKQPVVSADGNLVLVADARVDNRDQVARELRLHNCDSHVSDARLALSAYATWGPSCVRHIVGDYTIVVFDQRRRRLWIARDPFGTKPLFYFSSHREFSFASTIKALISGRGVPNELNAWRLAAYLVDLHAIGRNTFYKYVSRLPPAHDLRVTAAGSMLQQHWDPDQLPTVHLSRTRDYADALLAKLDEAVACRIRAVSPVAIMLSGGLDSSSVAALAARRLARTNQTLHAFTSVPFSCFRGPVPDHRVADESPFVESMRRMYPNLDANAVCSESAGPLTHISIDLTTLDRPPRNVINRYWIHALLERAMSTGVRVMLTGQHGNTTISFDGVTRSPSFRGRVARLLAPALPHALSRAAMRIAPHASEWGVSLAGWSRFLFIAERLALETNIVDSLLAESALFDHCSASRKVRYQSFLPGLAEFDELAASVAARYRIEFRDPTADVRLVEFCFGVPDNQFKQGALTRMLVRRAMHGLLSPMVLFNTRRGLQAADVSQRLEAELSIAEDTVAKLAGSRLADECLNLRSMRRALAAWRRGQVHADSRVHLLRALGLGLFLTRADGIS